MDEYNAGMDKEVKQYFKKIIASFSWEPCGCSPFQQQPSFLDWV
jgi:hypothetical protein